MYSYTIRYRQGGGNLRLPLATHSSILDSILHYRSTPVFPSTTTKSYNAHM